MAVVTVGMADMERRLHYSGNCTKKTKYLLSNRLSWDGVGAGSLYAEAQGNKFEYVQRGPCMVRGSRAREDFHVW